MKHFALSILLFFGCVTSYAAGTPPPAIEGYWQILGSNGKPESIAVVYEHDGKYFGRLVAIYDSSTGKINQTAADPKAKATGVPGNPPLCGLDFIWNLTLEQGGQRYIGVVMNPDNGNQYTCEVWIDKNTGSLVVRGEWFLFGENEYWPPIAEDKVPEGARVDFRTLIPVIQPQ